MHLDRRKTLCLFAREFQRRNYEHVPKNKWNSLGKVPWIPRTNNCNVSFVGIFVVFRTPQQAIIANCSGFRNFNWILKTVNGSANVKRNRFFLSGISKCEQNLLVTELAFDKLGAGAGFLINSNAEIRSKGLDIVIGNHEQVLKY